jgi:5-methylcytosine-specific restriction endonuclease McrA
VPNSEARNVLRVELENAIRSGRCAYCRRPASAETPLTREHVIPRAKGGSRRDVRIIVPACARCNQRRGCRELVAFLLGRPRRISAFLDHLGTLSPESIRQVDVRVFAELYAAVWILNESLGRGGEWRAHLRRLCSGRALHRRRYAARRVVGAVAGSIGGQRRREALPTAGPSCLLPAPGAAGEGPLLDESVERMRVRFLALLALAWQTPSEEIDLELRRQRAAAATRRRPTVVALDGWTRRARRRTRVDRRRGRVGGR